MWLTLSALGRSAHACLCVCVCVLGNLRMSWGLTFICCHWSLLSCLTFRKKLSPLPECTAATLGVIYSLLTQVFHISHCCTFSWRRRCPAAPQPMMLLPRETGICWHHRDLNDFMLRLNRQNAHELTSLRCCHPPVNYTCTHTQTRSLVCGESGWMRKSLCFHLSLFYGCISKSSRQVDHVRSITKWTLISCKHLQVPSNAMWNGTNRWRFYRWPIWFISHTILQLTYNF